MFTPAEAIAELDDALVKAGEDVVLQVTASGDVSGTPATVRAFVRGVRGEQLAGDYRQRELRVIISPTGLGSFPKQNDRVVVGGEVPKTVLDVETIRLAGVVVRHELRVEG